MNELSAIAFAIRPCELNLFLKSESKAMHMLTHKKASQIDPIRDANVNPPENIVTLVMTMAKGNNIIIKIAIFDHSFAVASGIASIHPSL